MASRVHGIHHVTALAGHPQSNVDFYAGVLGLRLVKRTVNFDDPSTYHLYYGDGNGAPGTIVTFFPWGRGTPRGRIGTGQVSTIALSIPPGALDYWTERLARRDVPFDDPADRFDETFVALRDPDGLRLELVTADDPRPGWVRAGVPPDKAVRGVHHVALSLAGYERTATLLTDSLGMRPVAETQGRFRFAAGDGGPGAIVDLLCTPDAPRGSMGRGVVHHVAWRADSDDEQGRLRRRLVEAGHDVTPVLDRNYFHSIYFREPGHVLFEVATDPPGFAVDETAAGLGTALMLPSWLEADRPAIERRLEPITSPAGDHLELEP